MEKELQRASAFVFERLEKRQRVSESLLASLSSSLASFISEFRADDEMGWEYENLASYVQSAFSNGLLSDNATQASFAVGAVWGMMELVEAFESERESGRSEVEQRSMLSKYEALFHAVAENPGITHGALAKKIDKTKGRLTQIVSEVERLHLLTFLTMGRTKHYYLSSEAESLISTSNGSGIVSYNSTMHSREEYLQFRCYVEGRIRKGEFLKHFDWLQREYKADIELMNGNEVLVWSQGTRMRPESALAGQTGNQYTLFALANQEGWKGEHGPAKNRIGRGVQSHRVLQ